MERARILCVLVWAALHAASAASQAAQRVDPIDDRPREGRTPEERRWVPGVSFFSMGLPEDRSALAMSGSLGREKGESVGFPWSVGGSLELATPVLADVPGRPRLYVHGDVGYAFDVDDPVLSSGDPGEPPRVTGNPQTVQGIENVGQSIRVEAVPLVLSGGVGAVMQFDVWDRTYRLRPSLEWIFRRDEIESILGAGENVVGGSQCGPCQTLFLRSQTEKGFHSLGPGIELEVDAARAGDFLVAFFASGRVFRILGDRKAELTTTGTFERTDGQPSTTADSFRIRYEREPWHYRFGVGVRLMWSPERRPPSGLRRR